MRLAYLLIFAAFIAYPLASMAEEKKPKQFPPQETPMDLEKNDAQWQCEQFILQSLDDPYKAIFEYFGMFPAEKNADGAYNVTATLQIDENAPKKKSVCTLKKTGPEQWQLVGIKELP